MQVNNKLFTGIQETGHVPSGMLDLLIIPLDKPNKPAEDVNSHGPPWQPPPQSQGPDWEMSGEPHEFICRSCRGPPPPSGGTSFLISRKYN